METAPTPAQPTPVATVVSTKSSLVDKFKKLTTLQKLTIGGGVIVALVAIILIIVFMQKNQPKRDVIVIAKVGDVSLTENYLDIEMKFYPGTPSAEIKKVITQKIIDDQVTLAAAKKDGVVSDYPQGDVLSEEEYLKRTEVVKTIKEKIDSKSNFIQGKTVMVWFYNNKHIGPGGIEASKKVAFSKIKPLYDKVKSGAMTIDQAGQTIKADKSISAIDPAWESNALALFKYYKNGSATFWPEYNTLVWKTEPGQITPLYLGGGILREGKPVEELYIFSQVDKKSDNGSDTDFTQWLEQKKKEYPVVYPSLSSLLKQLTLKTVFAQEQSNQSSNSGDNPDNGSRSGQWSGTARTMTGLPLPGVAINILSPCNGPSGRNEITDANGRYNTGTDYNLSCLCNPQKITATYNGEACTLSPSNFTRGGVLSPLSSIHVPNGDATMEQDIVCGPPPPPTPTPTPTPVPTPTPTPTPPPLACNEKCTSTTECEKSTTTGCTACLPNDTGTGTVCRPPAACNIACQRDDQCAGATKDGCTVCSPSSTGTGKVCSKPPACGTSCTRDDQCAGAFKDGCTVCESTTPGGPKTCVEPFDEATCKCDGFNAINISNPSQGNFKFEAFGKVEGKDLTKAKIDSMTFSLYKSSKSNPNSSTKIITSNAITPTIVSSDSGKLRYRAEWSVTPPAYDPNTIYRVGADPKCVRAKGPLTDAFDFNGTFYSSDSSKDQGQLNYTPARLAQANDNLELGTLKDGYYTRIVETDSCKFIRFEYGQY